MASPLYGFQLPNVGGPTDFSRQGLLDHYDQSQRASRNANQDLFDRTAQGFDRVLAGQRSDLAAVGNSYRSRQRAVMRGLQGANDANLRDIDRRFTANWGDTASDLIARGLGNSTIQSNLQMGNQRNWADAVTRSRNDFARSIADMRTQWGMQALQQQQAAALANSGLANQQISALFQGTNIGYPDMGAYSSMVARADNGGQNPFNLGGGGGGGGVIYGDPSRPIGGPGPQGAGFYTGGSGAGGMEFAGSGFYGAPGLQQSYNPAPATTAASFDPRAFADYSGAGPQSEAYGYGSKVPAYYGNFTPQAESMGYWNEMPSYSTYQD